MTAVTEPASAGYAGYKIGQAFAIGAGSVIAGGLMVGPWYQRLLAAGCGCLSAIVLAPILDPIAIHFWAMFLNSIGVPPAEMSPDSIRGGTDFLVGLTGVDICRWLIDRTKGGLKMLTIPFQGRTPQ